MAINPESIGFHHTFVDTFVKAAAANQTDASFPNKIPTLTEPTGNAVIDLSTGGEVINNIIIVPFGTDAADETFKLRCIGWWFIGTKGSGTEVWIPILLSEVTCTLSATVGVATGDIDNTEFFVDTLVLDTGNANISTEIVSPTGDEIAHIVQDVKGFAKSELTFDRNSSAASCNALVKKMG